MTSHLNAARRGFAKGSIAQVYTCRCCSRRTRPTGNGDNELAFLCEECYDLAGEENHLSDTAEFYGSPEEVLRLVAAVATKGGNINCWTELVATANAFIAAKKEA